MAFIDSTSTQRVELLRQAEKTANLTRRVTIGSGNLGEGEGVVGNTLCTDLASSLAAIGYGDGGSVGPNQKLVTDDVYFPVYPNWPDTDGQYDMKFQIVDGVVLGYSIP